MLTLNRNICNYKNSYQSGKKVRQSNSKWMCNSGIAKRRGLDLLGVANGRKLYKRIT